MNKTDEVSTEQTSFIIFIFKGFKKKTAGAGYDLRLRETERHRYINNF